MNPSDLMSATCRVALAAYLHDLGKLAERARIDVPAAELEANKHQYCPFNARGGWHSHVHAAYTALAMDRIESLLPPLKDAAVFPFAAWKSREADDSLINAAARHHRPETFLQWVIAAADRLASGFERSTFAEYNLAGEENPARKNRYQARQWPLFEQISLQTGAPSRLPAHRYPLRPLAPEALFPQPANTCEPGDDKRAVAEYRALWDGFVAQLEEIPESHRANLPLWLDHFDSLWLTYAHAVPSATAAKTPQGFVAIPADVSLYDHSRTAAALAAALWRYHHERRDDPEAARAALGGGSQDAETKFLLVQADFHGIQDFIFATGGETQKRAARLLRGRSFYVSLLAECAALRVLDALGLPPTSQVTNAAGKFLIVAPNTEATRTALEAVRRELDAWFLEYTFGQAGIGLAWLAAASQDFESPATAAKTPDGKTPAGKGPNGKGPGGKVGTADTLAETGFARLVRRLFAELETAKLQRFGLCGEAAPAAVFENFLDAFNNDLGVCVLDGRSPAAKPLSGSKDKAASRLALDQVKVGEALTGFSRLLIACDGLEDRESLPVLGLKVFGYQVGFTGEDTGRFGALAADGRLRRVWDFAAPASADASLFAGLARRFLNGYVPRWQDGEWCNERYDMPERQENPRPGAFKALDDLACEDRIQDPTDHWQGIRALATLKGDVDHLGLIFQRGLRVPTFAKMAALSRQLNGFFAIYLPWLCKSRFPNTYTVFAGGDDFFLIGPWASQIRLAGELRTRFTDYTRNPEIHFSAGLSLSKPGLPIRALATTGEEALTRAKDAGRDRVTVHGRTVEWGRLQDLAGAEARLGELQSAWSLSTAYLYALLGYAERAGSPRPEDALWASQFSYRTWRHLAARRGMSDAERRRAQTEIGADVGEQGLRRFGADYRIALFNLLYRQRD